ncbi:hypothetical protein DMENIID0001_024950 [Sergentomyia squamirostris]
MAEEIHNGYIGEMKNYQRISFSCELSDRLDEYALYYNHLSKSSICLFNLYSWQLILLITNNFVATTFQLFMQYVLISMQLKGEYSNITANILTGGVLVVCNVDFILHGFASQQLKDEAKQIGIILHTIPTHRMDIRLKRSVSEI